MSFFLVEDDDFQRDVLAKALDSLNPGSVHTVNDGQAAIDLLKSLKRPPDVILLDLDMPGMDGMEFLRRLSASSHRPSVIITSGLERNLVASVKTMAEAYGINLLGIAQKPITRDKLEELLKRHNGQEQALMTPVNRAAPSFSSDEILQGLRNDEFEPFFQPKVRIASGAVVGAEALARWRHPHYGTVAAAAFINTLEERGQIDALLRRMLIEAVDFCNILQANSYGITVAVNVSITSLAHVDTADQITEIVRSRNVDPNRIILEITESAVTSEVGKVLENLVRLRMRGFGLSIDDYGTGYSSMQQLTRVPFTELKIDKSFVAQAMSSESAKVVVAETIEMARRLGIQVVAEGVETRGEWDLLSDLGCDIAQGYYTARPMSGPSYLEWMRAWRGCEGSGKAAGGA